MLDGKVAGGSISVSDGMMFVSVDSVSGDSISVVILFEEYAVVGLPADRAWPGRGITGVISFPGSARSTRPLAEVVVTFRVSNRRR
jgi:hypothetical protein